MPGPGAIGTRVEGLEASRRALEQVLRAERAAIPEVLDVVGQVATGEIRERAPLKTGRLRRSYTWEVDARGRWVEISSNVVYAPYQEFGTRYIGGKPHVRPGLDATLRQIPEIIAEGLARAARNAARGWTVGGPGAGRLGGVISRLGG